MGDSTLSFYEQPLHLVIVRSFYIDRHEITYEEWNQVVDWGIAHGYTDLPRGENGFNPNGTNNPVITLSWQDIIKWCNARSEKYGFSPVYYYDSTMSIIYRTGKVKYNYNYSKWSVNGFRLPTEAEWEFAARGGIMSHGYKYSGSNNINDVAWYKGNAKGGTHEVGTKAPNELGIYDMSRNVWEWCWDGFGLYPEHTQINPTGDTTSALRVIRGGGSFNRNSDGFDDSTSVTVRGGDYCTWTDFFGFRCVRQQNNHEK